MPKKKLILFGAIAAVVLLLGGAAAFLLGGKKENKPAVAEAEAAPPAEHTSKGKKEDHGGVAGLLGSSKAIFYPLPDIVVNLSSTGRRSATAYLKIKINLELSSTSDQASIEAVLPRVVDSLQMYLRELKVEDIQGSEGLYRLREELLHRVSMAVAPAKVNDLLFSEMLMQ
ncbi:MAG: flagellar basal body-associated FliL family protein [Holosporales bacterium]|jgi:flagellar FliL protein